VPRTITLAAMHESAFGTDRRFAAPSEPGQLTEGHQKRPVPSLVWSREPDLTLKKHMCRSRKYSTRPSDVIQHDRGEIWYALSE
jgi:hypothetical protein